MHDMLRHGNLKHLVYRLERAIKCMDEDRGVGKEDRGVGKEDRGVGKMTVILDLNNYSSLTRPHMRRYTYEYI